MSSLTATAANALQRYIHARPAGWTAVRETIRSGHTKGKDVAILLDIDSDVVKVVGLREVASLNSGHPDAAEQIRQMLKGRDESKGQEVFLVKCKDSAHVMRASVKLAPADCAYETGRETMSRESNVTKKLLEKDIGSSN